MADAAMHLRLSRDLEQQAEHFAESAPPMPSWEVVFCFYAAVHLVTSCLLATPGAGPIGSHGEREDRLKSDPQAKSIRGAYLDLKALSVSARYDPGFKLRPADRATAWKLHATIKAALTALARARSVGGA